ncbi:tripartite tricarboxylate transporter substrate binding protein [Xylophilus sp. GOD-11R]|uniref:tripartite tricarboxylate transporter substrate binding protein n=1 Tax=Xylophilus sp. GOD-11R TaxID=3089814 RepID=UPI00298D3E65|nr:tripartite tricarboxylate transporter substrate binding protein [Xylophilus sp. GOD-11R]WPB56723.1 tripartite tricarboxylate transporter substrate binding protein [Xylophilus sp. GOD-11R]
MIDSFLRSTIARRRLLQAAGAALLTGTGCGLALAAAYPTKPVRIVAGFPPGGAADLLARVLADRLGTLYDQPVVVDNKPGAGGSVGAGVVAKAPADGYNLLLGVTASQTIAPSIYPALAYKAEADFSPVSMLAQIPVALVVHPSLEARTPAQLVALAKAANPPLTFASSGNGAIPHLTAELFKTSQGVPMEHIPYRGAAPAMADLLAGRVQVMFDHLPSVLPHIRSGKLRALGIAGAARAHALPDLPTLTEQGVRDVEVSSWFGLLAPAGTPQAIVDQLNADTVRLFGTDVTAQKLAAIGAEGVTSSPESFSRVIRADTIKWARIVKETGAKAD